MASLRDLKKYYPEYLNAEFIEKGLLTRNKEYVDIKVSNEKLHRFFDAILSFWNDIPSQLNCPDINLIHSLINKQQKRG